MPKAVRMADIARKVGVSTVTVSKALADKDGVSEEIRAKIKETAQEMGYQQGAASRRARTGSTGNIGILVAARFVHDGANSFYWELYQRVVSRLLTANYYGILELLPEETERQLALPHVLQDGKIDGLIVIGQVSSDYRRMLQEKMLVPTVFLDTYDSGDTGCSVISDGYYGMYLVTSYVLARGHRKVHFVGTLDATSSISDRYFGYCRAMMEHGLSVTPEMVLPDRDEHGSLRFALPQELPSAYVCNCDITAYQLISQLKERGLQVPADISVAGFDDFRVPYISVPEITTYAVNMSGMARTCVDALQQQIHHQHPVAGIKIVSGHLVTRDSVRQL